jgi:hypothetical protein
MQSYGFSKQRCAVLASKVCSFWLPCGTLGRFICFISGAYFFLRGPTEDGAKAPNTAQQHRPRPRAAAVYLGAQLVYIFFRVTTFVMLFKLFF